jgi:YebC/PmpR family DNA-binding regulatory protein
MSGHNKWSSIKHKKGAADAKRGKLFTRLAREIICAARNGTGDVDSNPRLRTAVNTARSANMPNANIEKAIKRGTGEIEGATYEEYTYEGYGPNGVAILLEVMTDNKNRTVAEVRHTFSKYGGSLAESGAVSWIFEQKGYILIEATDMSEDDAIMLALDAGAEDVAYDEGELEVYTTLAEFHVVQSFLEDKGLTIKEAGLTRIPSNTINADDFAEKLIKLTDKLEELDDVQKVFSNYAISEEILNRLAES